MKGNEFEYFLDNSIDFVNKSSLSTLLAKSSFAFLLLSMLFYWFQAIFNFKPIDLPLKGTVDKPIDIPRKGRVNEVINRKTLLEKIPSLAMWLANITLATLLFIRWVESGHFPLSNLYESLLFLSWSLTSIHFFLERAFNKRKFSDSLYLAIKASSSVSSASGDTPQRTCLPPSPKGDQLFGIAGKNRIGPFVSPECERISPLAGENSKITNDDSISVPLREKKSIDYLMGSPQLPKSSTHKGSSPPSQLGGMESPVSSITPPALTLGTITSPLALFINAFATFSLPKEMQKVTVLVPALHSNWLIMHVSVMMVSYAALLSGSLLAMAFLVVRFINDKANAFYLVQDCENSDSIDLVNKSIDLPSAAWEGTVDSASRAKSLAFIGKANDTTKLPSSGALRVSPLTGKEAVAPISTDDFASNSVEYAWVNGVDNGFLAAYQTLEQRFFSFLPVQDRIKSLDLAEILDNLSYRSIGLGFALLTIGIFSGAVWANEAWGSYWSWDPKETWAFVTWLVFAFYLHTRLSKGWVGKESAFVAIFGFLVVWFCYLGVNFFGKGLHSYGWFRPMNSP